MTEPYYSNPSGSQQQFPNMLTPVEDPDVEEHRRKVKRWGIIILILLIILGLVFIYWLYGTVQNNKDNALSGAETSSSATTHRSSSGGTAVAGTASRSSSQSATSTSKSATPTSATVTATPVSTLVGAPLAVIIPDPNATPAQKEATERALVYVNQQLTSKKELFYQLTSINGVSPSDARYAIEHIKVDYRKVAEQEAQVLESSGYTKDEIEEMLKSTDPLGKKFTADETKYAVQRLK